MKKYILFFSLFSLGLIHCGDEETQTQQGQVSATVYGEDFIEKGIPASEVGDGWAVDFERFVVTVEDIKIADRTLPNPEPVDLTNDSGGQGHVLSQMMVPEGAHTQSSYTISRVEVRGTATKDNVVKTFDWTFDEVTQYSKCETTTTVTEDGKATFQVTVHADHFLYDSLVSSEPGVLFQALADADTDMDGAITKQELEGTGLGGYDPGSSGEVKDLWGWLNAQGRTLGHVDGEGHCDAKVLK